MKARWNFNHTIVACYLGYITQAIVNNFAPLLFLTFQRTFGITLEKVSFLIAVNFGVQLLTDLISAVVAEKVGYRVCAVAAHILAAAGLAGLGWFPSLFADPWEGLLLAVVLYAIGGGLTEVVISPIVEAAPTEKKKEAMGLLHSFYCWGHMAIVLLSTLFFVTAGIGRWQVLTFLWAFLPLCNAFLFSRVPIRTLEDVTEDDSLTVKGLFQTGAFWFLVLLMVCSGASELGMSQWASAFAESGLHLSKTAGDLSGTCMFAFCMGISRTVYAKLSEKLALHTYMLACCVGCVCGYLLASLSPYPMAALAGCGICGLSVGVMWPGTFSMSRVVCPRGGTAMFALLALAGDLGGSAGPFLIGKIAGLSGGDLKKGLLAGAFFPVILALGLLRMPNR